MKWTHLYYSDVKFLHTKIVKIGLFSRGYSKNKAEYF